LNANAIIIPEQKIVIRQAGSEPAVTATAVEEEEKPTRTPRPTATSTTQPVTQQAALQPTQGASNTENSLALDRAAPRTGVDPLMIVIVSLMVGGLVLVIAGNVIKRAG